MGMYAYNTMRMQSFFAGSTIHIFLCPFALRILKVVLVHVKNDLSRHMKRILKSEIEFCSFTIEF